VQTRGYDLFLGPVQQPAQPRRFCHQFQQVTSSHTAFELVWENKAVGRKRETWKEAEE